MDGSWRDGGGCVGGEPDVGIAVRELASVMSAGVADGMALPAFLDSLDAKAREHGVNREALRRAFAAAHGEAFRVVLPATVA